MYGGKVAKEESDMEQIYDRVNSLYGSRSDVVINRGKSDDILPGINDEYFDWVYIDGNHQYEFVLSDLRHCLSKVKAGGIIAGDDYYWRPDEGCPVKRAVQDFIKEENLVSNLKVIGSQFLIRR